MTDNSDWFNAKYSEHVVLSIRIKERIFSTKSKYQKIEVLDSFEFGKVLALDDVINVTERDEFIYHEMLSHVPMFTHPSPGNVLVVGGGDGGVIREITKHSSLKRACLSEIDPEVVGVSEKYFPELSRSLGDPRVDLVFNNAADLIKSNQNIFDIIIVDSTDPIGAGEELFSLDFYKNCFRSLTHRGILCAQSESPFFDPDIVSRLYDIARQVFPIVRMYIAFMPSYVSGIWSFLYCSRHYDPINNFQAVRYNETPLKMNYYNDEIHKSSFALPSFIKKQFDL